MKEKNDQVTLKLMRKTKLTFSITLSKIDVHEFIAELRRSIEFTLGFFGFI